MRVDVINSATREEFEEVSQALLGLARHVLNQGAELEPVIAVRAPVPDEEFGDGAELKMGIGLLPVGMLQTEEAGDAGKNRVAALMHQMVLQPEVRLVGYMAEAWMSKAEPGADTSRIRPSEDPARTECVIITLLSADCQAMQICPIVRREDSVELTEEPLQFDRENGLSLRGRFMREPQVIN